MDNKKKNVAMAKVEPPSVPAEQRPLEDWEKQLQEKAADERSAVVQGAPRVTHKGGVLKIDGKAVQDNRLRVIPLGFCFAKTFYENDYQEGSSDTPVCYAFSAEGRDGKGLVPHPQAPKKQNPDCDSCPHNRIGTAIRGGGKRCSDKIRVAFILADDIAKHGDKDVNKIIPKAIIYQTDVPGTSHKGFGSFVTGLASTTAYGTVREAVAEITTAPRDKGGYFVNFSFLDAVPREAMPAIVKRSNDVYAMIAQPFPVISEESKADTRPIKGQQTKRR